MKTLLRLLRRLLIAVAIVILGSCVELALPSQQLNTAPEISDPVDRAPNSKVDVIVNIAPTPTPVPTLTVTPLPTLTSTPTPALTPTVNLRSMLSDRCREMSGRLADGYFPSKILGQSQHYRIYLPPCYDSPDNRTKYPVIYLFHGSPMDEQHWINLGVGNAADDLIGSGELPPFIIVMPRADLEGTYNYSNGGNNSWEGVVVNELMPYISRNYRTLEKRDYRAIGGISRGGVWSLEIAFRHPDLFESVGGHSPALSVNLSSPDYDPLVLGKNAPIGSLRIYLDAGQQDWTRASALQLSKILADRHLPYTFTTAPGDHEDDYWASQVEAYLRFYAAPWKMEKIVAAQAASQTP